MSVQSDSLLHRHFKYNFIDFLKATSRTGTLQVTLNINLIKIHNFQLEHFSTANLYSSPNIIRRMQSRTKNCLGM
jgi:hypothetical protein